MTHPTSQYYKFGQASIVIGQHHLHVLEIVLEVPLQLDLTTNGRTNLLTNHLEDGGGKLLSCDSNSFAQNKGQLLPERSGGPSPEAWGRLGVRPPQYRSLSF